MKYAREVVLAIRTYVRGSGGRHKNSLGTDVRLEILTTPDSKTTYEPNLRPILKTHFLVYPPMKKLQKQIQPFLFVCLFVCLFFATGP